MVKVFFYIQNNALRWFLGCCWMLWDALLPSWGARGREFESRRPDQENQRVRPIFGLAFFVYGDVGYKIGYKVANVS